MLAQKDSFINDASSPIYQLTQEEKIRLQCESREDYYRWQNYVEEEFARKEAALAEKDAEIARLKKLLSERKEYSGNTEQVHLTYKLSVNYPQAIDIRVYPRKVNASRVISYWLYKSGQATGNGASIFDSSLNGYHTLKDLNNAE